MQERWKILILEDNPSDVDMVKYELKKADMLFEILVTDTREEFIDGLRTLNPDLVLSDHSLPQFNSKEAFKIAREFNPLLPFILVTGAVSEEFAVECMKAGIDDYILKSSLKRLVPSIRNILDRTASVREKRVFEQVNRELADRNKELTDSITYAKRLQEAILPSQNMFKKLFPNSFMIFRPKHIVSGDFYWCTQLNDGRLVLAIVDCTGHGVPGAFMSVIGCTTLNNIVNIEGNTRPGKILEKMNQNVRRILKQDEEGASARDGMDMAICTFDKKNNLLEFAGANRPLCFVRNGKLEVVRGNATGIGGAHSQAETQFVEHRFKLNTLQAIYLYSDGYSDQFGGEDDKKMLSRNFLKLLKHFADLPMKEQASALEDWLEEWQGKYEQTDDILIAGIAL